VPVEVHASPEPMTPHPPGDLIVSQVSPFGSATVQYCDDDDVGVPVKLTYTENSSVSPTRRKAPLGCELAMGAPSAVWKTGANGCQGVMTGMLEATAYPGAVASRFATRASRLAKLPFRSVDFSASPGFHVFGTLA